ncbi:MAG: sugar ABC transporter permease [Ruthenibacterium sp.]
MGKYKENRKIMWMLIPCLLVYSLVMIAPLGHSLFLSFFKWKGFGALKPVGLDNYARLLTDPAIKTAVMNTIEFAFVSFIVMIPLSLLFATMLATIKRLNNFFSTLSYLPCVLSTVVASMMWVCLLNSDIGPINMILKNIGLASWAKPWLADPTYAMVCVCLVHAWLWTGQYVLIFYTSIQSISRDLYEAASIDGATKVMQFRHITLPLLRGSVIMNSILILIGSYKCFDIVFNMTNSGPAGSTEMLATYMYTNTFSRFDYGYGAAISMTIFVLSVATSFALQKFTAKSDNA